MHRSGGGEQRDDSRSGSCRRRSFGRNLVGHRHNVPGRIDKACYSVSVVPPLVFDSSERLTIFCFSSRTQGPHRFAPAIRHHDWYLSAVFRAVWFFLHQREHPPRLGIIVEEDISNRTHLSEIQGGASFRLPWALQVIPGLVLGTLMWIFPGEFRSPEERRKTWPFFRTTFMPSHASGLTPPGCSFFLNVRISPLVVRSRSRRRSAPDPRRCARPRRH